MADCSQHAAAQTAVILLGDDDTVGRHRDDLAEHAATQDCVIVEAFGFAPGDAAWHEELTEVEAVVAALGRAIADRRDIWMPFLLPDLGREQHWRRLSLVLQRHGLNLRSGRDLESFAVTGGSSEIDYALRREVQAVDELDHAALATAGAETLGREIERALADGGSAESTVPRRGAGGGGLPTLPEPTAPWAQRQPALRRYVCWLVYGCGVTQAASARVLNALGQRTAKDRRWQPGTVAALLNGRYERGARVCR